MQINGLAPVVFECDLYRVDKATVNTPHPMAGVAHSSLGCRNRTPLMDDVAVFASIELLGWRVIVREGWALVLCPKHHDAYDDVLVALP